MSVATTTQLADSETALFRGELEASFANARRQAQFAQPDDFLPDLATVQDMLGVQLALPAP